MQIKHQNRCAYLCGDQSGQAEWAIRVFNKVWGARDNMSYLVGCSEFTRFIDNIYGNGTVHC